MCAVHRDAGGPQQVPPRAVGAAGLEEQGEAADREGIVPGQLPGDDEGESGGGDGGQGWGVPEALHQAPVWTAYGGA